MGRRAVHPDVLELDGSDAGGQFVRSALALAALSGRPATVTGVRGARPEPGLRPQHLAAVRALAAVTDASVDGARVGSDRLVFRPGRVRGGRHAVDVGTAGSVALVCDAVLPLAARLDEPLVLSVRGGTDVLWAPPADYLARVSIPLRRRFGLSAALDVERRGFHPAGGGAVTLLVAPSRLAPLALDARGAPAGVAVHAVASDGLADAGVAERLAERAAAGATDAGRRVRERTVTYADTASPGAVVCLRAAYERSVAGFSALGERGTPAETVARRAVADLTAFDAAGAAVDVHAADQLLGHLALAGGRLRVPRVTDHVRRRLDLLGAFGHEVRVEDDPTAASAEPAPDEAVLVA